MHASFVIIDTFFFFFFFITGLKENFVKEFVANDIDGAALADVDNDDLSGMGIKKEENQSKLLKSIRKLFAESRPKTTAL